MDKHTNSRIAMIRTNNTYCIDHAADTASITDFAPTVTKVTNKLVLIDALVIVSSGTSKGVTLDSNALKKVMITDSAKLCGGLKALAGANNDNTMYEAANYTEPKLEALTKEKCADICEGIASLALTNKIALASKGITATDITDTQTAVTLYKASIDNTRNAIVDIKTAGDKIDPIVRDIIDNLLERQLDQLAFTLKTTNDTFYSAYTLTRKIVDTATHHTGIKAKFILKGAVPEKPIAGATFKFQSDDNTYLFTADIFGKIDEQIKNGLYIGQADAPGLKSAIVNSTEVKLGKTVDLIIEMEPV
jgi:hypothetical protein